MNTPPPLPSVFVFCCLGGWACLSFCCLGVGRVDFSLFGGGGGGGGGGAFCFFCSLGGCVLFFCCLGDGVFMFFPVWPGGGGGGACVFFFAVWAGDGSSLTYRSAWLVFKRPSNKKDQTAKKQNTRVPVYRFAV